MPLLLLLAGSFFTFVLLLFVVAFNAFVNTLAGLLAFCIFARAVIAATAAAVDGNTP